MDNFTGFGQQCEAQLFQERRINMREILFRGKDADNGEWVYGYYAHLKNTHDVKADIIYTGYADMYMGSILPECYEVNPKTIGQYTGLKDLHNTRIFEGDVVKSIAAWYVVEFENGGYGLRPFGKGKLIPIMGHGNFNENEVEVIGNVFDSPELLEGKQ